MQPELQRVEVETVRRRNHDLTVDDAVERQPGEQRIVQFGEVPVERPEVAALDEQLRPAPEDDRTEPVPLGLVEKRTRVRQAFGQLGQHGFDRGGDRERGVGHRAHNTREPTMSRTSAIVLLLTCGVIQSPAAIARCDLDALATLTSSSVTIRTAGRIEGRCRVQASVSAAPGSLINFEVWIPDRWNRKLVVTGNGGYSNTPSTRDMSQAVAAGYAAIGGDTGHQTATPDDLLWGAGHPERITDWGSRSIHAITGPGRRIVEIAGGESVRRSYFNGCSTGGHQAYAEIQRYPQDFDGVVAGPPGNNRVRLNAGFLWQFLANRRRGDKTPIIPASKLPMITQAIIAACDAN